MSRIIACSSRRFSLLPRRRPVVEEIERRLVANSPIDLLGDLFGLLESFNFAAPKTSGPVTNASSGDWYQYVQATDNGAGSDSDSGSGFVEAGYDGFDANASPGLASAGGTGYGNSSAYSSMGSDDGNGDQYVSAGVYCGNSSTTGAATAESGLNHNDAFGAGIASAGGTAIASGYASTSWNPNGDGMNAASNTASVANTSGAGGEGSSQSFFLGTEDEVTSDVGGYSTERENASADAFSGIFVDNVYRQSSSSMSLNDTTGSFYSNADEDFSGASGTLDLDSTYNPTNANLQASGSGSSSASWGTRRASVNYSNVFGRQNSDWSSFDDESTEANATDDLYTTSIENSGADAEAHLSAYAGVLYGSHIDVHEDTYLGQTTGTFAVSDASQISDDGGSTENSNAASGGAYSIFQVGASRNGRLFDGNNTVGQNSTNIGTAAGTLTADYAGNRNSVSAFGEIDADGHSASSVSNSASVRGTVQSSGNFTYGRIDVLSVDSTTTTAGNANSTPMAGAASGDTLRSSIHASAYATRGATSSSENEALTVSGGVTTHDAVINAIAPFNANGGVASSNWQSEFDPSGTSTFLADAMASTTGGTSTQVSAQFGGRYYSVGRLRMAVTPTSTSGSSMNLSGLSLKLTGEAGSGTALTISVGVDTNGDGNADTGLELISFVVGMYNPGGVRTVSASTTTSSGLTLNGSASGSLNTSTGVFTIPNFSILSGPVSSANKVVFEIDAHGKTSTTESATYGADSGESRIGFSYTFS